MHSALNLLVFPNSMFTPLLFFYERAMCSPEKYHLKITIIIIIIRILRICFMGFCQWNNLLFIPDLWNIFNAQY